MKAKRLLLGGVVVFAMGLGVGQALKAVAPARPATVKVVFENPRVAVRQITMEPTEIRPPRVRETDEVVLFCEESHYRAVNADGNEEPRDRLPGTVVFHKKGEQAPTLINKGPKAVRYYSLSLK